MPIYEYECSKCGRIDEVLQKFSDKPLASLSAVVTIKFAFPAVSLNNRFTDSRAV